MRRINAAAREYCGVTGSVASVDPAHCYTITAPPPPRPDRSANGSDSAALRRIAPLCRRNEAWYPLFVLAGVLPPPLRSNSISSSLTMSCCRDALACSSSQSRSSRSFGCDGQPPTLVVALPRCYSKRRCRLSWRAASRIQHWRPSNSALVMARRKMLSSEAYKGGLCRRESHRYRSLGGVAGAGSAGLRAQAGHTMWTADVQPA